MSNVVRLGPKGYGVIDGFNRPLPLAILDILLLQFELGTKPVFKKQLREGCLSGKFSRKDIEKEVLALAQNGLIELNRSQVAITEYGCLFMHRLEPKRQALRSKISNVFREHSEGIHIEALREMMHKKGACTNKSEVDDVVFEFCERGLVQISNMSSLCSLIRPTGQNPAS